MSGKLPTPPSSDAVDRALLDARDYLLSLQRPDGHWVAYSSSELGAREVFVESFPSPGRRVQVSAGGGNLPVWRRDGRELFYWHNDELVALRKPENLAAQSTPEVAKSRHAQCQQAIRKLADIFDVSVENRGSPTVILAQTVKGYGLGEAGEGRNITHQQKKLNEEEMRHFRDRFDIPISDDKIAEAPFYMPPEDSPEMKYLREHRRALGGFVPGRRSPTVKLKPPNWEDL